MLNKLVSVLMFLSVLQYTVRTNFSWLVQFKTILLIVIVILMALKLRKGASKLKNNEDGILVLIIFVCLLSITSIVHLFNSTIYNIVVEIIVFLLYLFLIYTAREKYINIYTIFKYNFYFSLILYILWEVDIFRSYMSDLSTISFFNLNSLSLFMLLFLVIMRTKIKFKLLLTFLVVFISYRVEAGGTILVSIYYILFLLTSRFSFWINIIFLNVLLAIQLVIAKNQIFYIGNLDLDNILTNRISLWTFYIQRLIEDKNALLTGFGDVSNFAVRTSNKFISNPHSMYITLLFENGVFIFILFVLFINYILIKYRQDKFILLFFVVNIYGLIYPMELGNFHAYGLYYLFSLLLLILNKRTEEEYCVKNNV